MEISNNYKTFETNEMKSNSKPPLPKNQNINRIVNIIQYDDSLLYEFIYHFFTCKSKKGETSGDETQFNRLNINDTKNNEDSIRYSINSYLSHEREDVKMSVTYDNHHEYYGVKVISIEHTTFAFFLAFIYVIAQFHSSSNDKWWSIALTKMTI